MVFEGVAQIETKSRKKEREQFDFFDFIVRIKPQAPLPHS